MGKRLTEAKDILVLFAAVATATLTACTRTESPTPQHENAVATLVTAQHQTVGREADAPASPPIKDSASLAAEAERSLAPTLLENDRYRLSADARQRLTTLNEATLKLSGDGASSPDYKRALEAYRKAFLLGCDTELKGCTLIRYFAKDSRSSQVALKLALSETSVTKAYQMMNFAYAVQGAEANRELDSAYLKRGLEYDRELASRKDKNARAARRQHLEIMTQILSRAAAGEIPLEPKTIADLKPWSFEAAGDSELARVRELALAITLKKGIYGPDGQLTPDFRTRLESLAKENDSLIVRIDGAGSDAPGIRKLLDLKGAFPKDEHYFIFDSLYMERIDSARASLLWDATHRDVARGRKALIEYARARFALSIFTANREFQKFFQAKGKFSSSSVLTEALEKGRQVAELWREDLRRLARLGAFGERHLDDSTPDAQSMKFFFAGLDRNVKFLSGYPSMMIMIYHLARLDFSMEIPFVTSKVKLDATQILRWFFAGTLQPFLLFSDDGEALRQADVMQAFTFALKTGTLQSAGISNVEFFKIVINQMLGKERVRVQGLISELATRFENSPVFQGFVKDCTDIKEKAVMKSSAPLETLQFYTALGLPQVSSRANLMSPKMSAAWSYYDTDPKGILMEEYLEIVRMEYSPRIDQIAVLIDLLEANAKGSSSEKDAQVEEVRALLEPHLAVRRSFYKKIFSIHRSMATCIDKVIEFEDQTQRFAIRVVSEHLRQVHGEMSRLRSSGESAMQTSTNLGADPRLNMAELKAYESTQNLGFNKDYYRFSRLQALLRLKLAFEHGAKTALGDEAPKRLVGAFELPEGGIKGVSDDVKEGFLELAYHDDVESFISSGLSRFFARKMPVAHWWDMEATVGAGTRRLAFLAALYKTGQVDTLPRMRERLTAKELLEASLRTAGLLEITPEWQQALTAMSRESRFSSQEFLLNYSSRGNSRTVMGLGDFTSLHARKELLGYFAGKNEFQEDENAGGETRKADASLEGRMGFLKAAKDYFKAKKGLGGTTFAIPQESVARLERFYADRADSDLRRQAEFIEMAKELAAKPQAESRLPRWRYSLARLQAEPVPILSEPALEGFDYLVTLFYRLTRRPVPAGLLSHQTSGTDAN